MNTCTYCRINNANPGHKWCQQCYLIGGKVHTSPTFHTTALCSRCNQRPANPGRKWCETCFRNGGNVNLCTHCNRNPANPGHKWCQQCFLNPQSGNTGNVIKFYNSNAPYYEFTNFYMASFTVNGITYPSSEHYFQAHKFTPRSREFYHVLSQASPRAAFDAARSMNHLKLPTWVSIKDDIMRQALYHKFTQNPHLAALLRNTGTAHLIEDSPIDPYWGIGTGNGLNMLGKLLMELRKSI